MSEDNSYRERTCPQLSYEVLGPALPGERCTLCGKGGGVKRIKHRRAGHRCGEVDLWHPVCADRYFADMANPPVKVPDLGPDPLDEHGAPRLTRQNPSNGDEPELDRSGRRRIRPAPAPTPAVSGESRYFAALQEGVAARESKDRQKQIAIAAVLIAAFVGGVAVLSIVLLPIFFRGRTPTLQNHRRLLTEPAFSLRCKVPTN